MQIDGMTFKSRPNEKIDKYMTDVTYRVPSLLMRSKKKLLLQFPSSDV
jgi:hypothetical protein